MRQELFHGWRSVTLLSLAVGCTQEPLAPDTPAPGEAAQIIATTISVAGGQAVRETTSIDSAGGRYEYVSCRATMALDACAEAPQSRSGAVAAGAIDHLFAVASSSDFRKLRASYPRGAPVPPDYEETTLTITANERRRTITWEGGTHVPHVLASFYCRLRVARGDLIACVAA